jgi:hypothetical protein
VVLKGLQVADVEICNLHKIHSTQIVITVEVHKITKVSLIWLHYDSTENDPLLKHLRSLLNISRIIHLYLKKRLLLRMIPVDRISVYHLDVMDVLIMLFLEI